MQTHICRLIRTSALAIVAAAVVSGCATTDEDRGKNEEEIPLMAMSAPARATVERETAGGQVESIIRETERGRLVYDVEASVGGKHLEYLIADSDGAILGTETQIEFNQLPAPVQTEAEGLFGTTSGLMIMRGEEYGETSFEVSGNKDGKRVEATFNPKGKRLE